ncbi:hypothetical protein [Streptomyces sp. HUAS TT7]|uniref:hypothetical protein n=1 Tax=Streptomyces sp. HUAS TT7 TaxID=3447507 RepID=UPI003F65A452
MPMRAPGHPGQAPIDDSMEEPKMASKAQINRIIRTTENKLASVQRRELGHLTGAERRAILRHTTVGAIQVGRGKGHGRADSRAERIWGEAETRLRAELQAARSLLQQQTTQAATAKVTKRAESRWW